MTDTTDLEATLERASQLDGELAERRRQLELLDTEIAELRPLAALPLPSPPRRFWWWLATLIGALTPPVGCSAMYVGLAKASEPGPPELGGDLTLEPVWKLTPHRCVAGWHTGFRGVTLVDRDAGRSIQIVDVLGDADRNRAYLNGPGIHDHELSPATCRTFRGWTVWLGHEDDVTGELEVDCPFIGRSRIVGRLTFDDCL